MAIRLRASSQIALPLNIIISRLPELGKLYVVPNGDVSAQFGTVHPQITAVGQPVASAIVVYIPSEDGYGDPYDSFGYRVGLEGMSITSVEAVVSLGIQVHYLLFTPDY